MEIPIYMFTGFLESGKSSFIKETMADEDFAGGRKILLILCEEGEVEFEEDFLKECNAAVEVISHSDELTTKFFIDAANKHKPEFIIIEYNGVWNLDDILNLPLPSQFVWAEILSTIDASTFEGYVANMRQMIINQVRESDVVIFNRCTEGTPKGSYRRVIKAVNMRSQIIYETVDGQIDDAADEELPYDINSDKIDILDEDYGIWYLDGMENPDVYDGKSVTFTAIAYKSPKLTKNEFVPGRFVMACCEEDIAFYGFICKYDGQVEFEDKEWVKVTADISVESRKEYRGKGLVLNLKKLEKTEKPEQDLLFFG
ncbi:TIGR03943 family protein [Acetitomaculum ruminis DSM 5522]|uniref:TIGR03943 family protein n=1 Tax=Acetitomaculum ruminis DSM 5522 TaxID=1120918 RepID=A0A1I0V3C0_9FIRM|nr:GTP-binding protein [Acetitomaculum ruminis]SFA70537.1 TIGR03943 family protein [Acetitomaculum ruminis DSM 5522]